MQVICNRDVFRASGICRFIVDSVARRTTAGGDLTTRDTVSRTSVVAGARSFTGDAGNGSRMDARQWAIRILREPLVFQSAPQSAIRLHLLRDPVNRPISRP